MVRESNDTYENTNTPAADLAGLVADVQYLRRRRRNGVQTGGDEEEEERSKPEPDIPSEWYRKFLMRVEDYGRARG